jgi:hypothetical protein
MKTIRLGKYPDHYGWKDVVRSAWKEYLGVVAEIPVNTSSTLDMERLFAEYCVHVTKEMQVDVDEMAEFVKSLMDEDQREKEEYDDDFIVESQ